MTLHSPYSDLDASAFWRSAVADRDALDPGDLYRPKFPIDPQARIVTAGSCFAQHVGRVLAMNGFNIRDAEPFPGRLDTARAQAFGYGLYSGRYGNIYTARQLLQLVLETRGKHQPAHPVWEKDGRFFDALRPNVEPEGLDSPAQVARHRELHLNAIRPLFRRADMMVFTFGLTEAWVHRESGTVYPTAPGTIAGDFDPEVFAFKNFEYDEILADFEQTMTLLRRGNPDMRFLVTTSPVPLTATASGQHVEVATCYSKSVLRAVCGTLASRHDHVDYFPSYEIITSLNTRGVYFKSNKRSVSELGVATAMGLFLRAHGVDPGGPTAAATDRAKGRKAPTEDDDEVVCEDMLLEAFAK